MTNELSRTLGARQTLIFDLETMFGSGATAGDSGVGGHRIQERAVGRNEDRDRKGRRLRRALPGAGRAGLFPVRPAQTPGRCLS